MRNMILGLLGLTLAGSQTMAQPVASSPEIEACKASGLIALRTTHPAVKSLAIDSETASVSKTDLMIEQTRVRTIVLGLASIDTAKAAKPNQFVCMIGDKGKVLLTFFTEK